MAIESRPTRRIAPLDVERFFERHFTKVGDQTRHQLGASPARAVNTRRQGQRDSDTEAWARMVVVEADRFRGRST